MSNNTTAQSLVGLLEGEPTPEEILATFEDYANTASVNYRAVREVIDRADLSAEHLNKAYEHMQTGLVKAVERGQLITGLDYLQSMNHIARSLVRKGVEPEEVSRSSLLSQLKADFLQAHSLRSKPFLDLALAVFRTYALTTNPHKFVEGGATKVKLTKHSDVTPGEPGIYTEVYNLARFGGSITPYDYLHAIEADKNLEIVEGKRK